MQFFTRLVFLDGILVPVRSVSCEWTDDGRCAAQIQLVPSYEGEEILESTHVHVFHVESGLLARRKRIIALSQEARADASSLFAEEAAATVGSLYRPRIDPELINEGRGAVLLRTMARHGMHLRFGGEVISSGTSDSSVQGAGVTLTCRGYDHLMDRIAAIQLTRGTGTLAEGERQFFGQQDGVFDGTGRNSFFEGLADLVADSEEGLAQAVRQLAALYPARINPMWSNRFGWARLNDQIVAVDGDTTISRLFETRAFRDYIKDVAQANYLMPLRKALGAILDIAMHKIIAIPSPAFFPLYVPPEPRQVTRTTVSKRQVTEGWYVYVRVGSRSYFRRPLGWDNPLTAYHGGEQVRTGEDDNGVMTYGWQYKDFLGNFLTEPMEYVTEGGGTYRGSIGKNQSEIRWTIPEGRNGGPAEYSIRTGDPNHRNEDYGDPREQFHSGDEYRFSVAHKHPYEFEREFLTVDISVDYLQEGVAIDTTESVEEVEYNPSKGDGLYDGSWSRLGAYAILPHLWWACPPACNVLFPEDVRDFQMSDPGMDKPTRLLGKISPGRSGSSTTFVDKFVAPNVRELNAGSGAPGEEPEDPGILHRPEYISGPNAQIAYFEKLHRLARESDWEEYLRSYLSVEFWNRRLGAVQANVVARLNVRPVVGSQMLVVRRQSGSEGQFQTPEQRHWLRRLASLRDMLRAMNECLSRLGGNARTARALRQHIQALYAIRAAVQEIPEMVQPAGADKLLNIAAIQNGDFSVGVFFSLMQGLSFASPLMFAHDTIGGGTNAYLTTEERFTRQHIDDLIGDPLAYQVLEANPNPYPTLHQLSEWYELIPTRVYDPSGCRGALQRDVALVEDAIAEARTRLRALGVQDRAEPSVLGYVQSITDSTSGDGTLNIRLTHVRRVGKDLDWDGLGGDDVESVVAFGEDGFMDERYSIERIGKEVYLPVFGCSSIADTAEARAELDRQDDVVEEVSGLPPVDGSDVSVRFEHPEVCGHNCTEENDDGREVTGIDTATACMAIIRRYRELKAGEADGETIQAWAETVRARASATIPDLYRGLPVVMGDDEAQPVKLDLTRDGLGAYADGQVLEGFFQGSFLAGSVDYERVAVVTVDDDGEEVPNEVTENEKDLLLARVEAVLRYVESVPDKTFSRS